MKNPLSLSFLILFFGLAIISCSDDDDNSNNNPGGGGNNSGCGGGPSTVTDIDGNTYNVVTIGNQCWMKENLKVSKYRNGNPIPTNLSDTQWEDTTIGAYAVYDNDPANDSIYGKLYNWYAVADPRGLCPVGWHVPTKSEWNILVNTVDPQADTSVSIAIQSQIAGGLMKATGTLQAGTGLWESPNAGATNSSGFTGLPSGARDYNGPYGSIGSYGDWWSSTEDSPSGAWARSIGYNTTGFSRIYYTKTLGLAVRCVRD